MFTGQVRDSGTGEVLYVRSEKLARAIAQALNGYEAGGAAGDAAARYYAGSRAKVGSGWQLISSGSTVRHTARFGDGILGSASTRALASRAAEALNQVDPAMAKVAQRGIGWF